MAAHSRNHQFWSGVERFANIDPFEQGLTLASICGSLRCSDRYPVFQSAVASATDWLSRYLPVMPTVILTRHEPDDGSTATVTPPPRFWPLALAGSQRRKFLYRSDVRYGSDPQQTLDIWRDRDISIGDAPVLIFVPGGGWLHSGRLLQGFTLMSEMAQRGWVCLSVSYRTSPRHRWPLHVRDVVAAVAWAKRNAAEFGGDPGFVAIAGASAGAHLASLAALAPSDAAFRAGLSPDDDTAVAAAVSFYGRYSWTDRSTPARDQFIRFIERVIIGQSMRKHPELFSDASPIARVNAGAPPFLAVHGECDRVIAVSEARAFVERLRAVSLASVVYLEIAGAGHGFDLTNRLATHLAVSTAGDFLDSIHLGQHHDDAHAV